MTEDCGGVLFSAGHTCGSCQRLYLLRFANSCSWGTDPRLVELEEDDG